MTEPGNITPTDQINPADPANEGGEQLEQRTVRLLMQQLQTMITGSIETAMPTLENAIATKVTNSLQAGGAQEIHHGAGSLLSQLPNPQALTGICIMAEGNSSNSSTPTPLVSLNKPLVSLNTLLVSFGHTQQKLLAWDLAPRQRQKSLQNAFGKENILT